MDIVIIGVGNPGRGDDAVGLIAARRLQERAPAGVTIVERSGEATGLMAAWSGARVAVVIDAVQSGAAPGTVHRMDASAGLVSGAELRCSTHSFGVAEAIELSRALGSLPDTVLVYGVEARAFEHGAAMSDPVAAAVDDVVDRILREVAARG